MAEQVTGLGTTTLVKASRVELADSALHAPGAGFGDEDFYPDLYDKAAVLTCRFAWSALITVFRLMPDATATAVLPPRPSISAAAPATTRRWTSFRCGSTTSKNRPSASPVTSTPPRYYARTNLTRIGKPPAEALAPIGRRPVDTPKSIVQRVAPVWLRRTRGEPEALTEPDCGNVPRRSS